MPSQEFVRAKTLHSLMNAVLHAPILGFMLWQSGDVVSARTWLVKESLKKGATHILFVDSDMQFGPDTINQLLSHKKEIVGVEYYKRKLPLEPIHKPIDKQSKIEIYKAGFVGTGLLLIQLSIFTNKLRPLKEPWFNFGRNKEGKIVIGEDVWFCNTAREAGYDIWVDPKVKTMHIGEFSYGQ